MSPHDACKPLNDTFKVRVGLCGPSMQGGRKEAGRILPGYHRSAVLSLRDETWTVGTEDGVRARPKGEGGVLLVI